MDYNLAKQLKEAGFPLKPCNVGPDCEQWCFMPHQNPIHAPTLDELIEACGEEFRALIKLKTGFQVNGSDGGTFVEGSTRSEAVANLWLLSKGE